MAKISSKKVSKSKKQTLTQKRVVKATLITLAIMILVTALVTYFIQFKLRFHSDFKTRYGLAQTKELIKLVPALTVIAAGVASALVLMREIPVKYIGRMVILAHLLLATVVCYSKMLTVLSSSAIFLIEAAYFYVFYSLWATYTTKN